MTVIARQSLPEYLRVVFHFRCNTIQDHRRLLSSNFEYVKCIEYTVY
jgi:hypothetical protein